MDGTTLPSFLCFYHQNVERRAHLCTSTYCVLVHFYLFTEGYFQYTAVQLYFVEIWYIEHIDRWGKCWGEKKYSGWWNEERGNASGKNHDHTSLLSFLQMKSKCLVLLTIFSAFVPNLPPWSTLEWIAVCLEHASPPQNHRNDARLSFEVGCLRGSRIQCERRGDAAAFNPLKEYFDIWLSYI